MAETLSFLAVSDLHVGHKLGLMPPLVEMYDANSHHRMKVRASEVQRKIYEEWRFMVRENQGVDYLLGNGDLCEGQNRFEGGYGCWSTEAETQVTTCINLLEQIRAKRVLITQGSGYHTGHNPSLDAYVANKMGAVFENEAVLKVGGIQFWCKHEVPISAKLENRPNTLGGSFRDAEIYREEYGDIDVILRGHAHYFLEVRQPGVHGVVLPGWKGKDAFQQKQKNGYAPHLGWVRFDVTGREYDMEVHTFTLKNRNIMNVVS